MWKTQPKVISQWNYQELTVQPLYSMTNLVTSTLQQQSLACSWSYLHELSVSMYCNCWCSFNCSMCCYTILVHTALLYSFAETQICLEMAVKMDVGD